MAYATINDVFTLYPRISTLVGTGTNDVTSTEVASSYIAQAEAFIDSYVSLRWQTPFSPVPTLITHVAANIAICNMVFERTAKPPQIITDRWERQMDILKSLRDGNMTLVGSGAVAVSSGDQEVWSTTKDYHPVFSSVLDPLDQRADSDLVDSDNDDRSGDTI